MALGSVNNRRRAGFGSVGLSSAARNACHCAGGSVNSFCSASSISATAQALCTMKSVMVCPLRRAPLRKSASSVAEIRALIRRDFNGRGEVAMRCLGTYNVCQVLITTLRFSQQTVKRKARTKQQGGQMKIECQSPNISANEVLGRLRAIGADLVQSEFRKAQAAKPRSPDPAGEVNQ